ncbi:zinc ribbon domain-containing protein [Pyruvatibacter sp.]|uniref:zinc ribbon domain-containing protein n=1 Tax=Pyruvatibacter sp. TaxID=1981328 RepID=UPI0032EB57F8
MFFSDNCGTSGDDSLSKNQAFAAAKQRQNINQDFPLRGFVNCAACDRPMTAGWSKGRTARYPYYICQTKGCSEHRKSVRKEAMEGDFRALLVELTPVPELLGMARKMLSRLWDAQHKRHASSALDAKSKAQALAQKSEAVMQRLMDADDPKLVNVYEKQIVKLKGERRLLLEKAKNPVPQQAGFEQLYRTACPFLSNPCKYGIQEFWSTKNCS